MDSPHYAEIIQLLQRQFQATLRGRATVYENSAGTGLILEFYNQLVVQLDLPNEKISFLVMDESGNSSDYQLFQNVDWNNDYELKHVVHCLRQAYAIYHQEHPNVPPFLFPALKDF